MDNFISSRQNRKIVDACALSDRKNREKAGLFCFEGKKLLWEAAARGVRIETVFLREDAQEELIPPSLPASCAVYRVSRSVYEKISFEKSPEGVFCIAKTIDKFHKFATIYNSREKAAPGSTLLFAVRLQDPGNLGTIMRTAAAFDVREVILTSDCADLYHPRTLRASMGTLFDLPVTVVSDAKASVAALQDQGILVCASALDRDALPPQALDGDAPLCFLLGNEGNGLPADLIARCDRKVFIPMKENCESLNVSIAAAILLYGRFGRFR